MSGFSASWLALREPADHRARDAGVSDAAGRLLADRDEIHILDLGCGSGSNLRALAPRLGGSQHWRLVDHDPALLDAARTALSTWAESARETIGGGLDLVTAGKRIFVDFIAADIERDVQTLLEPPTDLVTAAAFFDLASAQWIERFCDSLVARAAPLYACLTYDGVERWSPSHPHEAAMLAVFHAHQATDKGFGPAAGPRAATILANCLRARGWNVVAGDSPWRLDRTDAGLIAALADGSAAAVAETGLAPAAEIAEWLAARRNATACVIGHADLFASPPPQRDSAANRPGSGLDVFPRGNASRFP